MSDQIVGVPVPKVAEQIVEAVTLMLHEEMCERICEQIMDVPVPRVAEQLIDVPKIASPRVMKEIKYLQQGIQRKEPGKRPENS